MLTELLVTARRVQEGLALDTSLLARPLSTQAHYSRSSPIEQATIAPHLNVTSAQPLSAAAQPQYVQVPVQVVRPDSQAPWLRRQPNISRESQWYPPSFWGDLLMSLASR